jgi:hypothetical protein
MKFGLGVMQIDGDVRVLTDLARAAEQAEMAFSSGIELPLSSRLSRVHQNCKAEKL